MRKLATGSVILFVCSCLVMLPLALKNQLIFRMPSMPPGPDGQTLAQELGYPPLARLLVVNSDDTAAHPSFTDGVARVMPLGMVTSTSIIVHDRNDLEIQRFARLADSHPDWGVGIHLMLTNEYQELYPWAPVLSREEVPSLYNEAGLAWEKISDIQLHANPDEVAKEFRAQIQKALDAGINLTHIDSHMGTYYRDSHYPGASISALRQAAIAQAVAFDLPITMNTFDRASQADIEYLDEQGILRPDTFFGFYELEDINRSIGYRKNTIAGWFIARLVNFSLGLEIPYENQMSTESDLPLRLELYLRALKSVTRPGLNHVFMHAAVEHGESNVEIPRGKNHAQGVDRIVRLGDTAVFSNPAVRRFMEQNELYLVNYADVRSVQRSWRKHYQGEG
ncbi:MAG: ChbG/HpnK family deacetylase [Halioglobus sp.]|nr:ChbG/HpnK family deacetylase [Halioglobus sp.]